MISCETPQGRCLSGFSRADVTPPVGIYHRMWGAASHERSTGVHRPLTATAWVCRALAAAAADGAGTDGSRDEEVVTIAIDHCLLWPREMQAMLLNLSKACELPPERILVAFSHTHSAGLMGMERASLPGGDLIAPYLSNLATTLARLIAEARRNLHEVTISYAQGKCNLAAQRDLWDEASQQHVCGFNPNASADDTVLMARFTNTAGQCVANVVNYACHPTTLAWQNTLISPDYVGAMREVVEHATGAPCLFLQGASGDLGPRDGFSGDLALADRNGRQLGHAAVSAWEAMPAAGTRFVYTGPVVSGATIGTWGHQPLPADELVRQTRWQHRHLKIPLAYREGLPTVEELNSEMAHRQAALKSAREAGDAVAVRDASALVEIITRQLVRLSHRPPGATFPLEVHLLRVGDGVWVYAEAEHYQLLQRALRSRFPGVPILLTTVTNGTLPTYLPTRETYGTGIYQETIALLAAGCLERVVEAVGEALAEWFPEGEGE